MTLPKVTQINKIVNILDNLRMELMKARCDESFNVEIEILKKMENSAYIMTIEALEMLSKIKK